MKTSPENTLASPDKSISVSDVIVPIRSAEYSTHLFVDGNGGEVIFAKDSSETEYSHKPPKLETLIAYAAEQYADGSLRKVADRIARKEYDDETNLYADVLAAALLIGKDGNPNKQFNRNAIEEFFAFCSGNADAVQSLLERSLHLEDLYELRKNKVYEQSKKHSEEFGGSIELDPKDILLVHVTNHEPELDSNGNVVLRPTGYYEDIARATIHFTVNSTVKNHLFGNAWQDKDRYVTLVSLSDLLNNGTVPTLVNGVDTYFAVSPGDKLVLPNAVVIHDPTKENEELDKVADDAIRQKGALDVYTASPHYLEGGTAVRATDFSNALAELAIKIGSIPGPLHIDTAVSNLETAFVSSSVEQSDIFVETYLASPIEAIRWAMLHGQLPTLHKIANEDDGIFY